MRLRSVEMKLPKICAFDSGESLGLSRLSISAHKGRSLGPDVADGEMKT